MTEKSRGVAGRSNEICFDVGGCRDGAKAKAEAKEIRFGEAGSPDLPDRHRRAPKRAGYPP
jgi:hypothetical protein